MTTFTATETGRSGLTGLADRQPFCAPLWSGPEDVAKRLECIPKDATAKGMFLWSVANSMAILGGGTARRYVRFKDYPVREFVELAVECTRKVFPGLTTREGLRQLGQLVYPMFADTIVGTAIFSMAARSWRSTLELTPRAYNVSLTPGRLTLAEIDDHHAVLELRDVWSFPDSYQIGIFEGAMDRLNVRGEVLVRSHSMCDADLLIRWKP